ncbi:MAG TPA: glutaminase [Salinivirgaceae bacterium]|nr:glutaminase [Salinivirgaceae bacterium]
MNLSYSQAALKAFLEIQSSIGLGKVADYIPALAKADINSFGFAMRTNNGEEFMLGDAEQPFSIQSISKLLTLVLCLEKDDSILTTRVGIEPSGNPFNSLVQLEYENGIPRNPFINAGALVITDSLISHYSDPEKEILIFARMLSGNSNLNYNLEVRDSEKATGFRNVALVNFMKSYGNIDNECERVLNCYFTHCSLEMSCLDLVRTFDFLSRNGQHSSGKSILSYRQNKKVNALLLTCGTYDAVGNFAYKVGLPAKSGVGGGIVAVIPNEMVLAVWSPGLERSGNSYAGSLFLEHFTTITGKSIF